MSQEKYRGVLAKPLQSGEDPSSKLSALREALGVDTDSDGFLALAKRHVPGFKAPPRKRARRGRPNLLDRMHDLTGNWCTRVPGPDWAVAMMLERSFNYIEDIIAAARERGERMPVKQAAFKLMTEKNLKGLGDPFYNPFYVNNSVSPEGRSEIEHGIVALFSHRGRIRKKNEQALRLLDERVNTLSPWKYPLDVLAEAHERLLEEIRRRKAEGDSLEMVLEGYPERFVKLAHDAFVERSVKEFGTPFAFDPISYPPGKLTTNYVPRWPLDDCTPGRTGATAN